MRYLARTWSTLAQRVAAAGGEDGERGDVPGWVLVTLMTAGLVAVLWFAAEGVLQNLFVDAVEGVAPRPGG